MSEDFPHWKYNIKALSRAVYAIGVIQKHEFLPFHMIEGAQKDRNIHAIQKTIGALINSGVPPLKILIAFKLEGSMFTRRIQKSTNHEMFVFEKTWKYNEICSIQSTASEWKRIYSKQFDLTALDDGKQVIVYESSRTFANKMRYAMKRGLAGAVVGLINDDDYLGKCNQDDTFIDFTPREGIIFKFSQWNENTFPMLRTINAAIEMTYDEIQQNSTLSSAGDVIPSDPARIAHPIRCPPQFSENDQDKSKVQSDSNDENSKFQSDSNDENILNVENENPTIINEYYNNLNDTNAGTEVNGSASTFAYNVHCIIFVVIIVSSVYQLQL